MSAATYSGNPCNRGHDGTRYVSTRGCVQCAKDRESSRDARPYVAKAERAPGRRTVKAGHERRPAKRTTLPKVQGETLAPAPALPPMGDGQALDIHALGQALAGALLEHGRMHLAVTLLEGGTWQAVTLRPGYKDQVTRCSSDAGEALALALQGSRGRADELLDVVG